MSGDIGELEEILKNAKKLKSNINKNMEEKQKTFVAKNKSNSNTWARETTQKNLLLIELESFIKSLESKLPQTQGGKHKKSRRNRRKSMRRKIFI